MSTLPAKFVGLSGPKGPSTIPRFLPEDVRYPHRRWRASAAWTKAQMELFGTPVDGLITHVTFGPRSTLVHCLCGLFFEWDACDIFEWDVCDTRSRPTLPLVHRLCDLFFEWDACDTRSRPTLPLV